MVEQGLDSKLTMFGVVEVYDALCAAGCRHMLDDGELVVTLSTFASDEIEVYVRGSGTVVELVRDVLHADFVIIREYPRARHSAAPDGTSFCLVDIASSDAVTEPLNLRQQTVS